MSVTSSPHARGSSRDETQQLDRGAVVPARAGIFPRPSPSARWRSGRPRTRGDLPSLAEMWVLTRWSSPHARGSSRLYALHHVDIAVVPARAGIFPRT
ncbi:hypothetical protein Francci3_0025 [Frankia casuarinae]|uniref:Uncharacterized protein n=1 Tax=Frankia casuarinae (strain DSM 45818 / CECT 9043 / HFP020203 / CcI3) TaxID=106370 RepID=Q2JH23_FRACC|nr:hypothetical protein Francci3_0025 [Frankia casuarinae]